VTDSTVAVDFYHSLDVECNITAKVTFHGVIVFNYVTELCNLLFSQILCTGIRIDTCLFKDIICALASNTVNVGKGDLNALGIWNINTSYTSHSLFHLSV
jgi:hypothetical protein